MTDMVTLTIDKVNEQVQNNWYNNHQKETSIYFSTQDIPSKMFPKYRLIVEHTEAIENQRFQFETPINENHSAIIDTLIENIEIQPNQQMTIKDFLLSNIELVDVIKEGMEIIDQATESNSFKLWLATTITFDDVVRLNLYNYSDIELDHALELEDEIEEQWYLDLSSDIRRKFTFCIR